MSSIWASLSGVRAYQSMLDVIGTNLANANSTGYKASRVTFAEAMSQTLRAASGGTGATGGTNPMQIGLGVEVAAITRNFNQGSLEDTGNALDLAMDGNGFFVLTNGSGNVFCRSTSFSVDASNNLVDSVTGFRLLNVNNQPITIPYNVQIPAAKTTAITVAGNLSTEADTPQTEVLKTVSAFTTGSAAALATTGLNDLDSTGTDYVNGDIIRITGAMSDGTAVTATFTYGTDGTTLGDLINAVNTAFGGDATATLDADGNILLTASTHGDASLSLSFSNDTAGTGRTDWATHTIYVQTDGSSGGTRTASITIYDSAGQSHILTLTFQRTGEMEWRMTAAMGDTDGTLTKSSINGIRFNTDGSFNSVISAGSGTQQITIDYGTQAEPQTIVFEFGTSGSFNGLTQFGGSSTAAVTNQNGYASGTLKSFSISSDGTIQGQYTNNQNKDLGQILVATFDNPEGLQSLGSGIWGSTINSGEAILGAAMSGRAGSIVSSALEGSNVESAEELTKLIIAQHGFQLNTRAMSVSNRIIQELAQII